LCWIGIATAAIAATATSANENRNGRNDQPAEQVIFDERLANC
jgi:hypothetical protein